MPSQRCIGSCLLVMQKEADEQEPQRPPAARTEHERRSMSRGPGQPPNNPPEQLSLLSEEELANLRRPPSVPQVPKGKISPFKFQGDRRVHYSRNVVQLKLPGF